MVTAPEGVGTFTLPPRTASLSEIRRSAWMSSRLRKKHARALNLDQRVAGWAATDPGRSSSIQN
jgi:hypothetical protein